MSPETPTVPDREQIESALDRLLHSGDFDASERNRNFLRYIIDETLAGRGERIKGYTVATSVFGRHATFDPQIDPIVRIEARRLRRSLERYYLMGGRSDPMVIGIPKGGYMPTFSAPASAPPDARTGSVPIAPVAPASRATMASLCPSIQVAGFDLEGDHSTAHDGTAFTRKVIVALTRFATIYVFGARAAREPRADGAHDAADAPPDYVLSGGISFEATRFAANVILTETKTGRCIWAEFYERSSKDQSPTALSDDVANAIGRTIAQPYGIIFSRRIRDILAKPLADQTAYEAVLRFYQYWRIYSRDEHEMVRIGLENAIVAEPDFAEPYSCLSMVLSDAFRFGYDEGHYSFDARARALSLAQRAVELAPDSSRAYQALSLARWFSKDVEASITALEIGFALNPNDTEIMAELGFRHALMMDWEKGVPLLERSFALNPLQRSTFRVALSLYHYMHGRFEAALAEARRVDAPNVLYGHIMVAISAARLGYVTETQAALSRLLEIDPDYADRVEADLARRNVHAGAVATIRDGLRLAGLVTPPDRSRRKRSARLLRVADAPGEP